MKKYFRVMAKLREFMDGEEIGRSWPFWTALTIALSSMALSSILITVYTPLSRDFSAAGFNNFLDIYNFPIKVFVASVPIIALVVAVHRSRQAAIQIQVATVQNRFSNYYKHVEEFEKYVGGITENDDLYFINVRLLHHHLYPESKSGDFKIDRVSFESITGRAFEGIAHALKPIASRGSSGELVFSPSGFDETEFLDNLRDALGFAYLKFRSPPDAYNTQVAVNAIGVSYSLLGSIYFETAIFDGASPELLEIIDRGRQKVDLSPEDVS